MKKFLTIFYITTIFLVSGCGNKINLENNKKIEFISNSSKILKFVEEDYYYEKDSIYKIFDGKYIMNNNTGTEVINYKKNFDITSFNIRRGILIKNKENKIYLSLFGDKYCSVKDYDSEKIEVYDIVDSSKCRKYYYNGDNLLAEIVSYGSNGNERVLLLYSNLLDEKSARFEWYKDGKLTNKNGIKYSLNEEEHGEFYVVITVEDGTVYTTEKVNF